MALHGTSLSKLLLLSRMLHGSGTGRVHVMEYRFRTVLTKDDWSLLITIRHSWEERAYPGHISSIRMTMGRLGSVEALSLSLESESVRWLHFLTEGLS